MTNAITRAKSKSEKMRLIVAQSNIHKLKLEAVAKKLEELDDLDRLEEFNQSQKMEYDELKKSYKGQAMAWIRFRKSHNLATDMIAVNWS